jgi:hypothetical protein
LPLISFLSHELFSTVLFDFQISKDLQELSMIDLEFHLISILIPWWS